MIAKNTIIIYLLIQLNQDLWILAIMYHTLCNIIKKTMKFIFITIY